jgi:hypothetical protein
VPVWVNAADAVSGFQFEDVTSLDDIQQAIRGKFAIGSSRDELGKLQQAYVNGEPVFANGTKQRTPQDPPAGTPTLMKGTRLRPEASKGESQLSFIAYDAGSPSQSASQSTADALPSVVVRHSGLMQISGELSSSFPGRYPLSFHGEN